MDSHLELTGAWSESADILTDELDRVVVSLGIGENCEVGIAETNRNLRLWGWITFLGGLAFLLIGLATLAVEVVVFLGTGDWPGVTAEGGLAWASPDLVADINRCLPGLGLVMSHAPQSAFYVIVGGVLLFCTSCLDRIAKVFSDPAPPPKRVCVACEQLVDPTATRCPNCTSFLYDDSGTCPFCRLTIHRLATRCPHCTSDLTA